MLLEGQEELKITRPFIYITELENINNHTRSKQNHIVSIGIKLNLFRKSTHNSEVPFFAQGTGVLEAQNPHTDLLLCVCNLFEPSQIGHSVVLSSS